MAVIEQFGTDLYKQIAKDARGNVVLSPYGAAAAVAMTRLGAAGTTADQIDGVLHTTGASDASTAFNSLAQELVKPRTASVTDAAHAPLLTTANQLWGQRAYSFERPFLDALATYYGAGLYLEDFAGATEQARSDINDWVARNTQDRITDLIPRGILDQNTRFALTNALYLKASWWKAFTKSLTKPMPFRRADGTVVQAPMMATYSQFPYHAGSGYQAVQMPYQGGLSMLVVVPDAGTFSAFEMGLSGAQLRSIVGGLERDYGVSLTFPKFQFRTETDLARPLSALGMPIAFTERADFSGVTRQEPLRLQAALQQTFIAVDEDGTEAAAATAFVGGATGGPPKSVELVVDRPFIFLIRDDATGAILFIGRVLDPTAS